MNRMQITKLTIALMAVMTAFSTHAVEQNGISHGMFSFAEDVTILANASSGVDNIYSAISATKNNTTVTIADGKTLNIKGDLSDNHIGGIFLISSQTNYELNVAGDISGQITTSLNKSIRGISALGNIDINGNVELVIDGGPSNVIGVGAWNGSQLRFSGESTKINIRTSLAQSSSVYGVQGSGANTVISFNANNNSIVVDNSSENKSYSYGVSTTSSLINFSGNSNITVFSNYGETYGVNVINNIDNRAVINFSGSEARVIVSGIDQAFGVRSSGSQSEINFTGDATSIEVKSQRSSAYAVRLEDGGYANFSGNAASLRAESETGDAYGVSAKNGSDASFAGNAEIMASNHGSDRNAYGIHVDSGKAAFGKSLRML